MRTKGLRAFLLSALVLAPLSVATAQAFSADEAGYLAPKEPNAPGYIAPEGRSAAPEGAPGYLQNTPDGYLPRSGSGGGGYLKSAPGANDGFVAAPAGSTEQINGGRLMLIAYAGFWLLSLAYISTLARRARAANKEVVDLRQQLLELDDRMEDLEAGRS